MEKRQFELCIQEVESSLLIEEPVHYILHVISSLVFNDFSNILAKILNANIIGTHNPLEFVRRNGTEGGFFSRGAVYGTIPNDIGMIQETDAFLFDYRVEHDCYAEVKYAGEALYRTCWGHMR